MSWELVIVSTRCWVEVIGVSMHIGCGTTLSIVLIVSAFDGVGSTEAKQVGNTFFCFCYKGPNILHHYGWPGAYIF